MSESLDLQSSGDGTVIPVRVAPRAGRDQIEGMRNGALRIRLKAPPVEGAANKALCEFLAKLLKCPKSNVVITRGERSRLKSVLVSGVSPSEIEHRLFSG